MQLIGMLDSPYVRRVAIALHYYNLAFEHQSLSVFRNVDEFSKINPLIKAPTLVCDNGEVLMDSTLILAYLQKLVGSKLSLMPESIEDYQKALRLIGLGLNACDKSVQIYYERDMRPKDRQHQPWLTRVASQLKTAYELIEAHVQSANGWLIEDRLTHADIAVCVAWQFTHHMIPGVIQLNHYPSLSQLSLQAEAARAFMQFPLAPGWQAQA